MIPFERVDLLEIKIFCVYFTPVRVSMEISFCFNFLV